MSNESGKHSPIRIWDVSIRIFHWLLALLIVVMYVSAKLEKFDIHILAGTAITVLLVFRIVWGLVGSSNARFSSLLHPVAAYKEYLGKLRKRSPGYSTGHSPIGSLSVIAMLAVLAVQVGTGLVATNVDGIVEGPFAYYVTYEYSRFASEIHLLNEQLLFALAILHIAAILFYYFYKKENLIVPMITGVANLPSDKAKLAPRLASPWFALSVLLIVALIIVILFLLYGGLMSLFL